MNFHPFGNAGATSLADASSVTAAAGNRVFTDRFKNGAVANSDSVSGYWTPRNSSASSTVVETTNEPLKLKAAGSGYPHAQVTSAVRSDLNFFDAPITLEATGIGFSSPTNSYSKSILRFVLSPVDAPVASTPRSEK